MLKQSILTETEKKVIQKKLNNEKMTKQDSYYLSVSIRPKLKEMISMDPELLLNKLKYNQKAISIENNIKKIITGEVKDVDSIILVGSAIQTNYSKYKDIDVLVITKKKIYKKLIDKYRKTKELKEKLNKLGIITDIQIYDKKTIEKSYPHSPSLIYQLKDKKVIYGQINLPKKIELYNIDLRMKLDWSDIQDTEPNGNEIYHAIRNVILVRLLLNNIVDNKKLRESLNDELGKLLIEKLKNNKESSIERRNALVYLKNLTEKTENEIKGGLWEKKVQLTV